MPFRTFEVFVGDLADCGCDIVVNSSNTRLARGHRHQIQGRRALGGRRLRTADGVRGG
jgi:hypothetical protein